MKTCWILDIGAADHVCVSLSNFFSYKTIKPIPINLPDGYHVLANYSSTIVFNQICYLSNVLYVPNFAINLISVSKLTSDFDYKLIFSLNKCDIQDNVTNERVGTVKTTYGLYILDYVVFCNSAFKTIAYSYNTTDKNQNLWHNRMGHISDEQLSVLRTQFVFITANKTRV